MNRFRAVAAAAILAALMPCEAPPARAADAAVRCPVIVRAVVAQPGQPRTLLFALRTNDGDRAGFGTIAAYTADNRRFDLPFPTQLFGEDADTVLAYTFPQAVELTGAYVATLGYDAPKPCTIEGPWTTNAEVPDAELRNIGAAAATPSDAGSATAEPPPPCGQFSAKARTISTAPVQRAGLGVRTGVVDVVVLLDAQSRVVGTLIKSSTDPALDTPALAATALSRFETEQFRCVHIPGAYRFRVEFGSVERGPPPPAPVG